MRRVLTALLAAALLIGGGVAIALVSSPNAATAQESSEDTTEPDADTRAVRPERGEVLGGVLSDLVASGVITQDQADQITDALSTRIEELRAEFQERHAQFEFGRRWFHRGFVLGDVLADGVIDAEELAELGEDHPLNDPDGPAAEFLDDGRLTEEELDELKAELLPGGRGRHGSPFGNGGDADPNGAEGFFSG